MAAKALCPPEWKEGMCYDEFRKRIKVWQLLKVATPEQEGPLVFCTLSGKAEAACEELTLEQIGSANGLDLILAKLDALYHANKDQKFFVELDTFEKFRRPGSMSMGAFLLEFERLHNVIVKNKCNYPDGVLAYKVLKAANLSIESEKLCKATIVGAWSYQAMKDQLKKIFVDITAVPSNYDEKPVKVEPVMYAQNPNSQEDDNYDDYDDDDYNYDDVGRKFIVPSNLEYNDIYYGKYRPIRGNQGGSYYKRNFSGNNAQNPQKFPQRFNQQNNSNKRYIDINLKKLSDSYNSSPHIPNPKDNRGNYTTCRKCRSIFHWYQDCPHINNNSETPSQPQGGKVFYGNDTVDDQIYISLFQSSVPVSSDEVLCLVGETLNHAVIDSGCTKTVCGLKWFKAYCDTMSDDQRLHLERNSQESSAVFRFGDSPPVNSTQLVSLPVTIQNKNIYLPTEIVDADIPLLVSKQTLEHGKAILDCGEKTISLYGVKQPLLITSSGHHAIPIKPHSGELSSNIVMHAISEDTDLKAVSKKLHQQFGHPSADRLKKLIKNSGEDSEELFNAIDEVTDKCDTCKRYKRTSPRPVVAFPLATTFNDTLAMDLKVFKNNSIYLFHVIDHATRFSAGSVIYSKKAEVIVTNFFNIWISIFGAPKRILSDNGGEFCNRQFYDMCDNLNILFMNTAAEAHWSNGLVEKHNDLISMTVNKIIEDVQCSVEIALSWAINAKNSLQNIHGFSSYQLVFGHNPNIPTVSTNNLPALEGISTSKIIADQLNALHIARQEFIKSESSEKLRHALKSKTRTHSNIRFLQGETVFYKDEDDKRWKGSAVVIGQDGSKVLLKIPTGLKSIHSSRVILTSDSETNRELWDSNNHQMEQQEAPNQETHKDDIQINSNSDEHTEVQVGVKNSEYPNNDELLELAINSGLPTLETPIDQTVAQRDIQNETEVNEEPDGVNAEMIDQDAVNYSDQIKDSKDLPKNHQCVQYKLKDTDEWKRCTILGRGGKASGAYKYYLNIRDLSDNTEECIDWKSSVNEWRVINNIFVASSNDDFSLAKEKELENWEKMGVYEIVDNEGQNYVSVRWVLNEKVKEGIKVKKARLVARGYEDDLHDEQTDSPTINKDSLKLAFMISASKQWEIHSLDIKAAFLQGQPLTREVYIKPPREAKLKNKLWKLRQCVYGLKDSSRKFYFKVKEILLEVGCTNSRLDSSIFTYHQDGLQGILMSHVDDFFWAGTQAFESLAINKIKDVFKISSENSSLFKYLGLDIQQTQNGVIINQNKYAKDIEEILIDPKRLSNINSPLNEAEKTALRSAIGSLNWLVLQTRPDLAYDVCYLSTSLTHGNVSLLCEANRVIKKAKYEEIFLTFPPMDLENLTLVCYGDASFGNLRDGGSQMGFYMELRSGNLSCPIDWFSKRIRRCAKSTMAAETIAMVEALDHAYYTSKLLCQILYNDTSRTIPICAVTDNKSLFQSAKSTTAITDRRLRIEMAITREYIDEKDVALLWTESQNQLADCLTKKGCHNRKLIERISNFGC